MAVPTPTIISICTGAGGLDLGFRLAHPAARTICYVEREAFPVVNLVAAMEAHLLDAAPLWDDLTTFDGGPWGGVVDWLIGGIPCQPHSVAGKKRGAADERNLWPDARRVIGECLPSAVFLENVPGIARYYFDTIGPELRGLGYRTEEGLFSAAEVGAPHIRERFFVLGYADREVIGFAERGRERRLLRAGEWDEGGIGAGAPGGQLATDAVGPLAVAGGNRRGWRDDSGPGSGPVQMICYRLRDQGAHWPTATVSDAGETITYSDGKPKLSGAARRWPTALATDGSKAPKQHRNGDPIVTSLAKMWPTATVTPGAYTYARGNPDTLSLKLDGAARTFPTPSASDAKGFDGPGKAHPSKNWEAYSHLVRMTLNHGHECSPKCRRLNPLFVAWLMGWPGGWTQLPNGLNDSESLATEWFRWSQLMRYSLSRLGH